MNVCVGKYGLRAELIPSLLHVTEIEKFPRQSNRRRGVAMRRTVWTMSVAGSRNDPRVILLHITIVSEHALIQFVTTLGLLHARVILSQNCVIFHGHCVEILDLETV